MKSHGSLFARVCAPDELEAAMLRAARGKRSRPLVQAFLADAERELASLRAELLGGAYQPRPYTQFRVMDPKPRRISCADFRDRVVHHAVCAAIGPAIDRRLVADNFACRAGKGSHRALLRARHFARRHRFFLKTDIRRYYDSIDHRILLAAVGRLFRERPLVELIERIVRHPVPGQSSGKGLPIGNLTSQWLANLYLDPIDHWLKEERRAPGYVRYMDDLAVWADSKDFLWELVAGLDERLRVRLGLELKREATVVAPCSEGVPLLGWRIYPNLLRVQGARLRRTRRLLRRREEECAAGIIAEAELQAAARSMAAPRAFLGGGPRLARESADPSLRI